MSSLATMSDGGRSLTALELAAADRRGAEAEYIHYLAAEHRAVWDALDAGAQWPDLAWLIGEPESVIYSRHRMRGAPRSASLFMTGGTA